MKYEQLRGRKSADFQRLTGVSPVIFGRMVKCLQEQIGVFGRPCKLSLEDRLLLTLMYWREYRTMAHVALTYDVSEPTVHRTINRVENRVEAALQTTCCLADSGYKGIDKHHQNWRTPHKKSKKHPLTPAQKRENKELSRRRLLVEPVIRWLKRFALLRGTYRNRGKRFDLRFNLIAALYNAHLDL